MATITTPRRASFKSTRRVPWDSNILFDRGKGRLLSSSRPGGLDGSVRPLQGIEQEGAQAAVVGGQFDSVLAGAVYTSIAMNILAIELFGPSIAPYAAVSCVISFLMTGHRGVFPAQRIAARKSSSVEVEIGGEVGNAQPVYGRRDKILIDAEIKVADRLRKKKD